MENVKLRLSRKKIAAAILSNMSCSYTGAEPMGVFAWPPSQDVEYRTIQRGTEYRGPSIYRPEIFVKIDLDDDPWMWRKEARDALVEEGRIRAVPWEDQTEEEERLVDEYVDEYEKVWVEELRFLDATGDFTVEVEWTE